VTPSDAFCPFPPPPAARARHRVEPASCSFSLLSVCFIFQTDFHSFSVWPDPAIHRCSYSSFDEEGYSSYLLSYALALVLLKTTLTSLPVPRLLFSLSVERDRILLLLPPSPSHPVFFFICHRRAAFVMVRTTLRPATTIFQIACPLFPMRGSSPRNDSGVISPAPLILIMFDPDGFCLFFFCLAG